MSATPVHIPVLCNEIVSYSPAHTKNILDCTLGGGGHSHALLYQHQDARLVGIDRDEYAIAQTQIVLKNAQERIELYCKPFSQILEVLSEQNRTYDYMLADLGVSSFQLGLPDRGFSFLHDGPLDMRMNPNVQETAVSDLLEQASERELKKWLRELGEEPFASLIAKAIVAYRQHTRLTSTKQFATLVATTIPKRFHKKGFHPATKTFQALRMVINHEIEEIHQLLRQLLAFLSPHGRLAVISFHSLEDRVIKQQFQRWSSPCQCPPHLPYCVCGLKPLGKSLHRKPIRPTKEEVENNPRSRSAKLRIFERNEYELPQEDSSYFLDL